MDFSPLTTTAYLGGEDLAECFAPPAMLAHMLEFEATLASAQAALGLIPRDAAALIAQCAQNVRPGQDRRAERGSQQSRHPTGTSPHLGR